MRDEFLEPLPKKHLNATLLAGKKPIACYVVSETDEGFCVGIPEHEPYEGDPRLTLATEDEVVPVRLVLQEAHLDGFYFWLVRNEETDLASDCDQFERIRKAITQFGLPAIVAATLLVCLINPTSSVGSSESSFLAGCFGIATRQSSASEKLEVPRGESRQAKTEELASKRVEGNRASAPLISQTSLSTSNGVLRLDEAMDVSPATRVTSEPVVSSNALVTSEAKKQLSLKQLLEAGQIGRLQTITRHLVPWLFERHSNEVALTIRMSDAAYQDLLQFESGLRGLPRRAGMEAVRTLRESLDTILNEGWLAKPVIEMENVYVFPSRDAMIYFQRVRGRVELVRVLPIEFTSEN